MTGGSKTNHERTGSNSIDRIEILSVSYLNTHRELVKEFRNIGRRFKIGIGWHYLLDLCWAAIHIDLAQTTKALDAGAATGILQWWLAEKCIDVISVDRVSRNNLPLKFRANYRVQGLRPEDLNPIIKLDLYQYVPKSLSAVAAVFSHLANLLRAKAVISSPRGGTVYIYNQDLANLRDIEDDSIDVVVSISALEHNPSVTLGALITELMRVIKPGGQLIVTLGATKDENRYHAPSKGWCYTEHTLRRIFQLSPDCPSNYDRYDELFEALFNCAELRDNLADFYFKSGDNGMPWGIWDPQYQPVGVLKVKPYN